MTDESPSVQEQLDVVNKENGVIYGEINAAGADLDQTTILMVRLETLIESIFDEETKLVFNLRFQKRMNAELKNVLSQINRAKLTEGVSGVTENPGLVGP